jgi:hypothetical protein
MPRYQYPLEVHGVQTIIDNGLDVKEISVRDLLCEILGELKRLNDHMYVITEEEIEKEDFD